MNEDITRAKAIAGLLGAVVTALLGTVPPDSTFWQVLTFVAAVCTAVSVYAIPNKKKGA